MKGITFYLLAHGIAKLILRKTRAECVCFLTYLAEMASHLTIIYLN